MSANFTQVSGPGGRSQTIVPAAAVQTWLWNPSSLKGQLDGGDFLYAKRIKLRTTGFVTNTVGTGPTSLNQQQLQQALGQVRVFSQFLGEMVNKSSTSVSILTNHDAYFVNGFKPYTRKRPTSAVTTAVIVPVEIITEIPFEREYLERSTDSCPWMPFLEGGQIEVDMAANTSLLTYGWTPTGNWIQTCTIVRRQAGAHPLPGAVAPLQGHDAGPGVRDPRRRLAQRPRRRDGRLAPRRALVALQGELADRERLRLRLLRSVRRRRHPAGHGRDQPTGRAVPVAGVDR